MVKLNIKSVYKYLGHMKRLNNAWYINYKCKLKMYS